MSDATLFTSSFFLHRPVISPILPLQLQCFNVGSIVSRKGSLCLQVSKQGWMVAYQAKVRARSLQIMAATIRYEAEEEVKTYFGESDSTSFVQTLRKFPLEGLSGKVVLVRFDANLLLKEGLDFEVQSVRMALCTIKYLYNAGARLLLASDWSQSRKSTLLSAQAVADHLSSVIQLKVVPANRVSGNGQPKLEKHDAADILLVENLSKYKEELANCAVFAKKLSSGVDIFVNDAFALSHKILASTVGIARFCHSSVAGFCFEEELSKLIDITETKKHPYISIIGGGNLLQKAAALHHLASTCDGLVFVGSMAFQIMHALGLPISMKYVEHGAAGGAAEILQLALHRNIPILFPREFWCTSDSFPKMYDVFPCSGIPDGWTPVRLGPSSLKEIFSLLLKSKVRGYGDLTDHLVAKKVMWIGKVKFGASGDDIHAESDLAVLLERIHGNCDVTVVGHVACRAIIKSTSSLSSYNMFENASVVWEYLKGQRLPGIAALDRDYPFDLHWDAMFADVSLPLAVDIGSGNGLFLLRMAEKRKDLNFLGLEINKKLVARCLHFVSQHGFANVYFITTNATTTFRSIISRYPGKLVFASIQCPNPDFNKVVHRWRMVQQVLVEAIVDLLSTDGKVYLQSDVLEVALRMKEQFMMHAKGRLQIVNGVDDIKLDDEGWLEDNPFGIRSDWEQHVNDRGAPMYRLLMTKASQKL